MMYIVNKDLEMMLGSQCSFITLCPIDSGLLLTIGRFYLLTYVHSHRGTHRSDPHGASVTMRLILMMIPVELGLRSGDHKSVRSGSEEP